LDESQGFIEKLVEILEHFTAVPKKLTARNDPKRPVLAILHLRFFA